ncbi:MAG: alpha/beta hydrolase [Asgard group archaeon]|nr:alpha/beta hydrolase [Asgard group archaeon]
MILREILVCLMTESNFPNMLEEQLTSDITQSYYYLPGNCDLTLVYIHGLGSSKDDSFFLFNNQLFHEYTKLAVDLIGHGDSSKPVDFSYTMADQAKIILLLLNKLNISKNIILISHSMGGPIAVTLAELLSKRVIGLIYAEGNLDAEDCTFSKLAIESYSLSEWEARGFDHYLKLFLKDPENLEYAKTYKKAGPRPFYLSAQDLVQVSVTDNLISRIEQLNIPVLAIYGDKNKGKFSSERKLAMNFPIVFIPNAGHAMMYDDPNAFSKVTSDFIQQIRPKK